MIVPITYKARLIFAARATAIFSWDADSHDWSLPTGDIARLHARHVSSLNEATEFHLDIGGFPTREAAREVGEKVRATLRLTNAVLGLGLNVPSADQEKDRARLAPPVKEKIAKEHGVKIVDCVFGLNVLEEGDEFELAVKGKVTARSKDSAYILEAGSQLWSIEDNLDTPSKLACELLNSASRDPSPRSAFLISFLALDLLMDRRERPHEAKKVLETLVKVVDESILDAAEKRRLRSMLGGWKKTSLPVELERLVSLGSNTNIVVNNEPLAVFLEGCTTLRHKLAHPPKDAEAAKHSDTESQMRYE